MTVPPPPQSVRTVEIVRFAPGPVTCGGQVVAGAVLSEPMLTTVTQYGATRPAVAATSLRFAIDPDGHARSIRPSEPFAEGGVYLDRSDLAPALAVARFPKAPRQDCTISFATSLTPIAQASPETLYALASRPAPFAAPPEVYDRTRPGGSTCARGPGQYRTLNNPAFETIAVPPGDWAWTFLAFDVSPDGTPRNVRLLGSSGTTALDRAGEQALSRNRYEPGAARLGCVYHYYRIGGDRTAVAELPADLPPSTDETIPACAIDPGTIAGLLSGQAYPTPFARRRIEGVAVVRYDTAPWGAIGNVRVLASEPASAFGETARVALASAAVRPSEAGHSGCVTRVLFRLPPEGPRT